MLTQIRSGGRALHARERIDPVLHGLNQRMTTPPRPRHVLRHNEACRSDREHEQAMGLGIARLSDLVHDACERSARSRSGNAPTHRLSGCVPRLTSRCSPQHPIRWGSLRKAIDVSPEFGAQARGPVPCAVRQKSIVTTCTCVARSGRHRSTLSPQPPSRSARGRPRRPIPSRWAPRSRRRGAAPAAVALVPHRLLGAAHEPCAGRGRSRQQGRARRWQRKPGRWGAAGPSSREIDRSVTM